MDTATQHTPGETTAIPKGVAGRFRAFKERHHIAFEVAFFFLGFGFDVLLLHRIDSTPLLIHQGTYLVLTALLIAVDHRIAVSGKEPTGRLGKLASYRTWVIHFFLGTLLNAFLVFYFRASSGLWAFLFIVALSAVLVINELPRFRERGPVVRVALLSFATTSYFAYLLPVMVGFLHWALFLGAVILGTGYTFALWRVYARISHDPKWTFRRAVAPGLAVQALLFGLYFLNVVPPVPLGLKDIGIFHEVTTTGTGASREFLCSKVATAPWLIWRRDDTDFRYQEPAAGDERPKVWAYVAIFAPRGFHDRLSFNWEYDDPKRGWVSRGSSFHDLGTGGATREEGFRTYAYSRVAGPGKHRVIIRSSDGREIGRKTLEAVNDLGDAPEFQIVKK